MDSATKILDIAERRMRSAGYNAVSYRDIAGEMGLKSASLHYHFPKKEDLGVALVRRYTDKFNAELSARTEGNSDPKEMVTALVDIYRHELVEQHLVCLCAVLGAEAAGLPHPVTDEVKSFFEANIDWLTKRYKDLKVKSPIVQAKTTLSLLEGTMIISSVNDDITIFDAAEVMIKAQMG